MGRNISKEKRDALVEALSDLSVYLNSSGEQDQCATHIETIRTAMLELNRTKYGLVFEDHEESIDETIAASVPYLMTVEEGCINNGGVTNYLIEGDNLGALNVLSRKAVVIQCLVKLVSTARISPLIGTPIGTANGSPLCTSVSWQPMSFFRMTVLFLFLLMTMNKLT